MFDLGFRKAALHVYNYFGSLRKTSRVINVSIASLSRWLQRIDPLKRLTAPKTATDALVQLVKDLMTSRRCIYCTDVVKHLCSLGIYVSRQLVYTIVTKRLCLSFKRSRTRGFNPSNNVHFDIFLHLWFTVKSKWISSFTSPQVVVRRTVNSAFFALKSLLVKNEIQTQDAEHVFLCMPQCLDWQDVPQ